MKTKAQQAIELRNQANTKLDEMNGLVEAAETRNADFTEQEQTDYDNLKKEVESLQRRAGRLEASAATEARQQAPATVIPGEAGGNSEKREKQKIISEYRFANVIKAKLENRPLDGLEAEMHQEAREEAKANGVTLDISGVAVPAFFISADKRWHRMSNTERRDMVAGTDTAGGHTIETDLGELIPALRPKLKVVEMGATMLGGLQGNLDIPRQTTVTTATWKAENAAAAETTPAFDKISFTPNRLTAYTNVSNTLLAQSAIVTEGFVRRDLEIAVQTALDLAAINGSGTAPEPKGILNFAGIGSVAGGTNGAAPTLGNIIDLETEIAKDNADVANMAYLTTPGIRGKLKKTALDAGSGRS